MPLQGSIRYEAMKLRALGGLHYVHEYGETERARQCFGWSPSVYMMMNPKVFALDALTCNQDVLAPAITSRTRNFQFGKNYENFINNHYMLPAQPFE